MSTLESRSIVSDANASVVPFTQTRGAPPQALATAMRDDADLWRDACDRMLSWRSNPTLFDPADRPAIDVLDAAIDFAVDELDRRGPAPSIIVPSGDGAVAFEWHSRDRVMIIEFVGRGRAVYTIFDHGKVTSEGSLVRDPQSRRLELQG